MNAHTSELFAYLDVIARENAQIGGVISFKLCSANKKVTPWLEGRPENLSQCRSEANILILSRQREKSNPEQCTEMQVNH